MTSHGLGRTFCFTFTCCADTVNINVGGPVWSMAWCPLNDGHTASQYLSLYTHRHADDIHTFQQLSHDAAVIQLYDCGILSSGYQSYTLSSF